MECTRGVDGGPERSGNNANITLMLEILKRLNKKEIEM